MKTYVWEKPVEPAKPVAEPVSPLVPERYYFVQGALVGISVAAIVGVVGWPDEVGFGSVVNALARALAWGIGVGAGTAILLSLVSLVKDWVYEFLDWKRLREWSKKDRQRALDEAEQKFVTVELPTGERLFFIGLEVLMREWLDGKGSNRDDMVAAGVCSQAEWGMLNALFLHLRLKVGHKFMKLEGDGPVDGRFTFDAAVSLYRSMVAVVPPDERRDDPGGLWVAGHGRWMKENVQPKKRGKK